MNLLRFPNYLLQKTTGFWQENALFIQELKYFRQTVILALVGSIVSSVLEGVGIWLLLALLQNLIQPDQHIETGIGWIDTVILGVREAATNQLLRLAVLLLIVTWLRSGLLYLQSLSTGIIEFKVVDRLRRKVFEQLQNLSLIYFTQTRSGELINSLTTEINRLRFFFTLFSSLFTDSLKLLVYATAILIISWQLSLIALLLLALLSLGLSQLRNSVREISFQLSQANGKFTSIATEFISGILTIHSFSTQDFERRRFYQASSEMTEVELRSLARSASVEPIGIAIGITTVLLLICLGLIFLNIPTASLLTFIYTLRTLTQVVQSMNRTSTQMSYFQGAASNIAELLKVEDKIYLENGHLPFYGLQHSIELSNVQFGYSSDHVVLSDINLTIPKGRMTALVGASGSGKTTLASLIPRFYDPLEGQVLVDGIDLRQFEIHSLRRRIAIVSQDTFIFNTSIRENVAYGSEGASDEAIWQAAELSNALEFILNLPEKFETQLGDRGVKLSGGQRQRIAIARALLRDPEILILDEATSALDSVSERLIQDSLERLSENRTVITIAHRLSTIARADQVVVLEKGRIVEQGNYQDLLEQRGKLWRYHQLQYETT